MNECFRTRRRGKALREFGWTILGLSLVLAGCGNNPPPTAPTTRGVDSDIILTRNEAIGAKYAAPGPRTCSTFRAPAEGLPSPEQIAKYVICGAEREAAGRLYLVDQVNVTQVSGGRPYNPNRDDTSSSIDINAPIYEVKGSATYYVCNQVNKPGGMDFGIDYHPGSNCTLEPAPNAEGTCYINTLHEWTCSLNDMNAVSNGQMRKPPPPAD